MSEPSGKHPDEQTFLWEQAEDAKAAISQIAREMRASLGESFDPKKLTESHPWLAVGGATAAGFVTAWLAIPSPEQRVARRLAKIEEELKAAVPPPAAETVGKRPTTFQKIFAMIRPTLITSVTSAVNSFLAAQAAAYQGSTARQNNTSGADGDAAVRDI